MTSVHAATCERPVNKLLLERVRQLSCLDAWAACAEKQPNKHTHTHTNILLKRYGVNVSEASGQALVLYIKARRMECNQKVATLAGWVFGDHLTVFVFAPPTRLLARFPRFGKER